jgi:hypothetical protein
LLIARDGSRATCPAQRLRTDDHVGHDDHDDHDPERVMPAEQAVAGEIRRGATHPLGARAKRDCAKTVTARPETVACPAAPVLSPAATPVYRRSSRSGAAIVAVLLTAASSAWPFPCRWFCVRLLDVGACSRP